MKALDSSLPRPLTPMMATTTLSPADLVSWAGDSEMKYEPAAKAAPVAADDWRKSRRSSGRDIGQLRLARIRGRVWKQCNMVRGPRSKVQIQGPRPGNTGQGTGDRKQGTGDRGQEAGAG